MRWSEIVDEDFIQPTEKGNSEEVNALVTLLSFLQRRTEELHAKPEISTDSLVNMMKRTGHSTFSYDSLVSANDNEAVKNLVQSFNKDKVTLAAGSSDTVSNDNDDAEKKEADTEKTVSSMAKKHLNK